MDKKLQLIRHLYDEADEETRLNELLEDPELKQEYQALSEAKFWLDHSKREKPSSDTLQAVLAMAMNPDSAHAPATEAPSHASKTTSRRPDRGAVPRQRSSRKRSFGITAFVMATMITAFVGYQWFAGNNALLDATGPQAMKQESVAAPNAEMEMADDAGFAAQELTSQEARQDADLIMDAQRANQALSEAALAPGLANIQAASVDTMPDWDKVDDIMIYKQRIDMLLEQNQDIAWDETAVPIESLQTTRPNDQRLRQAGSRASNN